MFHFTSRCLFQLSSKGHVLGAFQSAQKSIFNCQSYSSFEKSRKTLILFDCDGTLTKHKGLIHSDMEKYIFQVPSNLRLVSNNLLCSLFSLQYLKKRVTMGIVTGSDIVSIGNQLGGEQNLNHFKYIFTENGLIAHIDGKLVAQQR